MFSGDIIYEHSVALGLIVTGALAAVAVGLLTFWRYLPKNLAGWAILGLRLFFIALLTWCLLLPSLKRALTETLKPRFLVALDHSESMGLVPPGQTDPLRWKTARDVLDLPWTQALGAQCDLDGYPLAADLGAKSALHELLALAPDGKATSLRANLKKLIERYKGQTVCGLLLLSDGIDTREANDDWAGGEWPFPIYTVHIEPPNLWKIEADVRVDSVDTPRRVVVDWDTELKAGISGQGAGGQPVEVQLYEGDVLKQAIPVEIPDDGGSRALTFRLPHPVTGAFTYTVKVPPLQGETRTNDNAFSISVQVIDSKNRLLYVEGVPRWESKYMVRALKASKTLTPVCFVRGPGGKFLSYGTRSTVSPEMNESQLLNFKIVILGDLDAEELGPNRAASLMRYVENGGSLVLLGGAKAWGEKGYSAGPLQKLLPVRAQGRFGLQEGDYRAQITGEGRAHPAFLSDDKTPWTAVPPLLSYFSGAGLTPGASALVTTDDAHGNQPIIAVQKYGQGKVVAILTDSLWRWQLDPGKENPYQRFWNQMLLWLSPAEEDLKTYQLDLFADAERLFLGDAIGLRARLGGPELTPQQAAAVTCEITGPDNRKLPFSMARQDVATSSGKKYPGFGLDFTPELPGLYSATAVADIDGKKTASAPYSFYIKPFTPESNPRPANVKLLAALAQASKGRYCEPEEIDDILSAVTVQASEEERITYQSLWNHIAIIACLIALLSLEWILRKVKNLA